MRGRKAQAAMEFLMTYGWAILVVLVVIGALAYFGVLSPQKLLPDRCNMPPGVTCNDYKMTAGGILEVNIGNGLGKSITISSFTASDTENGACANAGPFAAISNGASTTISTAACSPALVAGEKKRLNFKMVYTFGASSTMTHTIEGDVYATVQDGAGPICGNTIVEAPEECDDGNSVPGDGCENDCTTT